MSITKEIIDQENTRSSSNCRILHLHKEGSFLRAYDWSAWLCCRYLHEFKVNKRSFKGIEQPVAYIGFPETSLDKWMPEGADLEVLDEKHLAVHLPEPMLEAMKPVELDVEYVEWKESIPLTENSPGIRKKGGGKNDGNNADGAEGTPLTLTAIMQRVLAFPIESKSPLECMIFLADIKQHMASLV